MKELSKVRLLLLAFILMAFGSASGQIKFKDVTKKAGLIEPLTGMVGHGAAWGDVNGDGFPDLFFGTFAYFGSYDYNQRGNESGAKPNALLLNNGDGTFSEVPDSPIRVRSWNSGAAFADFDNDGDLDLVVSHQHHVDQIFGKEGNFLYENDGNGNFTDVTEASGLYVEAPFLGRNTFVFDYDGDGLLDILLQDDFVLSKEARADSRLMKNMGGLHFKDVTAEAGLPTGWREGLHGLGGFVSDINGDGWPDIFFAHSCRMFINNKDGTFHEIFPNLIDPRFTLPATVNPHWTCGADIGDLNNDGKMDFVMGDHFGADTTVHRIYVFMNEGNDANGDPIFRDITYEAGASDPAGKTPHVQLQDIDNDGWVDLMVSNCSTFIYRNKGKLKNGVPQFEKPISSGIDGGIGYWAAGGFVDYDRDGRLDFFGAEWMPGVASPLLRNVSKGKNYIAVKAELENSPNRNAVGAKVEVFKAGMLGQEEGRLGIRQISPTNGYSSCVEAIAYFGLPKDKKVDIRLTMPCGGKVYTAESVKRNQMLVIH